MAILIIIKTKKIKKPKNTKAFTILGSIISLLILSFGVTAINMFLLDMLKYSSHLKSQTEMLVLDENKTACYFAHHNEQLCTEMLNEISKLYSKTKNI